MISHRHGQACIRLADYDKAKESFGKVINFALQIYTDPFPLLMNTEKCLCLFIWYMMVEGFNPIWVQPTK